MTCDRDDCRIAHPAPLTARTVPDLLLQLRDVIADCLRHGECFFIVESEAAHRYVQGLVDGDALHLESVSNESLGRACAAEHGLSRADEAALLRLGWRAPAGESLPNWHRSLDVGVHYPAALATELLVRTLVEVHRTEPAGLALSVAHAGRAPGRHAVDAA